MRVWLVNWFSFAESAGLQHNGIALTVFQHGDRSVPIVQARGHGDERSHYISIQDRWFVLTDEGAPIAISYGSRLHTDLDDILAALSISGLNDTVSAINASREAIEDRFADLFDGALIGGVE